MMSSFNGKARSGANTFRTQYTTGEEKAMKKEVHSLAMKTVWDIRVDRQRKKGEPDPRQDILKKLAPDFIPESQAKKRIKSAALKVAEKVPKPLPSIEDAVDIQKPKKPLNVSEIPGGDDLRRVRVSTMGVLPQPRQSLELNDLRIMMQGQTVSGLPGASATGGSHVTAIDQGIRDTENLSTVEEANLVREDSFSPRPLSAISSHVPQLSPFPPLAPPPSRAVVGIVGHLGTVAKVPVAIRHERPAPPKVIQTVKRPRKSPRVPKSEARVDVSDETASLGPSEYSIKSTQELLDEARMISETTEKTTHTPRRRASSLRQSSTSETGDPSKLPIRSVDEIISSLRNASKEGISEADRRIDELMQQVLAKTDVEEKREGEGDEAALIGEPSEIMEPGELPQTEEVTDKAGEPEDAPIGPKSEAIEATLAEFDEEERQKVPEPSMVTVAATEQDEAIESGIESGRPGSSVGEAEEAWTMTSEEARFYMTLNPHVTHEDLVSVQGLKANLPPPRRPTTRVSSAKEDHKTGAEGGAIEEKSIHHFCRPRKQTLPGQVVVEDDMSELPMEEMRRLWRLNHAPDRFRPALEKRLGLDQPAISEPQGQSRGYSAATGTSYADTYGTRDTGTATTTEPPSISASEVRAGEAADRVMFEVETLKEWELSALNALSESDKGEDMLAVQGERVLPNIDLLGNLWEPAPPKMLATPERVRNVLFPEYRGAFNDEGFGSAYSSTDEDSDVEATEEAAQRIIDPEFIKVRDKVLARKYASLEDVSIYALAKQERADQRLSPVKSQLSFGPDSDTKEVSDLAESLSPGGEQTASRSRLTSRELRRRFSSEERKSSQGSGSLAQEMPDWKIFPHFPKFRRVNSVPSVHFFEDDCLVICMDYAETMQEIAKQTELIQKKLKEPPKENGEMKEEQNTVEPGFEEEGKVVDVLHGAEGTIEESKDVGRKFSVVEAKAKGPTPAELALEAGRKYVLLPKKKKGQQKKPKHVSMARRDAIERFSRQKANPIIRRDSINTIKKPSDYEMRVPKKIRSRRRGSVPDLFEFDKWAKVNGYKGQEDARDWVVVIWDKWFDEIYPPPPEEETEVLPATGKGTRSPAMIKPGSAVAPSTPEVRVSQSQEAKRRRELTKEPIPLPDKIDAVLNEVDGEMKDDVVKMLEEEAERLTADMESSKKPNAFYLCRRGAIYRKVGYLRAAKEDLDSAIKLESLMLNAYWHRHLIHLLENRPYAALDDLNTLLKYDRKNTSAYKSRAEIFCRLDDNTMAVLNYTQAIKLNPKDYDAYFQRAELYEKRGEMRLALEDYANTTKLKPDKTEALFKHGLYYFQSEQWQFAINDFTDLLKQDPLDSRAYTYRGRALSKLGLFTPAVADFSAALHLHPTSPEAYYYRGCLLRKAQPHKALQDLSISLMLDDSEKNVMAYLHRGILYSEMGRHEDAIYDFEAVTELDQDIACAHVNLGLIYNKLELFPKAIKCFTAGLKADPCYIRAYVCRAETHSLMQDHRNALLDITRAIHLRPDNPTLYMYRGQYVLNIGNLELAAFCVRHAAELNEELGSDATQQALVQTFLRNYDKAVSALSTAIRSKPSQTLLILLGKTQMKAEYWRDAAITFQRCLDQLKPWNTNQPWPAAAAEINYMIGQCHMEQKKYSAAQEAFNAAISINTKYSEAFYQRGLCRMRLKQGQKGIQDFNRALAIEPTLYQVFLSRACYYAIRGRHSKAVLNCNEAIKLQPKCVRAYLYRGALKYHLKAYKLAIEDLGHTIRIDSDCALAFFNRAVCYHEAKEYCKALQDYGVILLLEGQNMRYEVLINRGLLYLDLGDYENALVDFVLADKDRPNNHRLLNTIGLCQHRLHNLKDSVRAYSRALDVQAGFIDSYIGRGNAFMDFGNVRGRELAKRDYERVLMIQPDHLFARINLAINLQVSGKFWQAWNQFTTVLAHHPNSWRALEGRAIVCLQMSDPTAALGDLNTALGIRSSAELFNNRGVVHQFLKDKSNAMRDYRKAALVDPNFSLAHYNQGIMFLHHRQLGQAVDSFSETIRLTPKDEGAWINRAIARALNKDYQEALVDLNHAVRLSPHTGHAYFNRGYLYFATGQFANAEKDFSKTLALLPDDPFVFKARADCRGKLGRRDLAIQDYKMAVYISSKLKGQ